MRGAGTGGTGLVPRNQDEREEQAQDVLDWGHVLQGEYEEQTQDVQNCGGAQEA